MCYKCHKKGHSARECPLYKSYASSFPNNKVNCCKSVVRDIFHSDRTMLNSNNGGKERLSYSDVQSVVDADEYHTRSYEHVLIDQLPSIPALIDSGAEVCCIREELLRPLHVLPHKFIKLSGLRGEPEMVGCVRLAIRPSIVEEDIINLAPKVRAWFAVVRCSSESQSHYNPYRS